MEEATDNTAEHVISDLDRSPPRGDAPARRATSPIHSDSRPAKSQYPREQMVVTRFFTRDTVFFEGPPQAERLEPGPILDANTSTALTHCLHMALKLLEESTGHRAFIETAKDIVSARREDAMKTNKPEVGIYANKSVDEMPTWVRKFLKQIREKGIPICVSEGIEDRYGFTQKWSWGSDMEDWDSATAAVVYINKGMVQGLLRAADSIEECMRQQSAIDTEILSRSIGTSEPLETTNPEKMQKLSSIRDAQENATVAFERSAFCISVTLAHEFVHCFTGFLTGRAGPPTPQRVVAGPYGSKDRGEAGWQWCDRTFGGLAHFWYTRGKPTKSDQIGIPMLLEWNEDESASFFYKMNHSVVKKIVALDFSADRTDQNWMKNVKELTEPKVPYKEWRVTNREVTAIWRHGSVIPDVDDQTQVASAFSTDFAFAASLEPVKMNITRPLQPKDLVMDEVT